MEAWTEQRVPVRIHHEVGRGSAKRSCEARHHHLPRRVIQAERIRAARACGITAWQQAQHRRTCAQQRPPAAVPWRGQWQGSCVHGPEGSSTTRTKVCLVRFPHSRHMGTCRRYQGGASARGSRPAISSRMVVLCRRHWDSNFCVERHHAGGRYKAACGRGCSRALSPVELDPFLWSDRRQLGVR